jgi:phosphatidylserine decarboxylase
MSDSTARLDDAPKPLARLFLQEDLNFLLTNRIPRRFATKVMARFSKIRNKTLTRLTLRVWQLFADDLHLEEAATTDFASLHECFIRQLKPGARPIDASEDVVTSPCDALVGAHGPIAGVRLLQAKGLHYTLADLTGDPEATERFERGTFVTLRLQANMYHRFHAPCDGQVKGVTYIAGDTWNVNPIAVARVERLFCRNERAVVDIEPRWPGTAIAMVPVAAILVGGIHFEFLPTPLTLSHRGQLRYACHAPVAKGAEIGRFEAGSTIILLLSGPFELAPGITEGRHIKVGEPLLRYVAYSPDPGGRTS